MTIYLVFGAYIAYWSMVVLMDAAFRTKKTNYAHIIETILGKKAGIALHIIFILTTFGAITIYYITAATFAPDMLISYGISEEIARAESTRRYIILGIAVILYPLFL